MKVTFREEDHSYWAGDRRLISVTQLLRKHGLGADFSMVDPEVLQKAADKGTYIHSEIENYIKKSEVGFTSELQDYIELSSGLNFAAVSSEVILPFEFNAEKHIFAGTADIMASTSEGKRILADIKTGSKIDLDACSWQLSLYEYLTDTEFDYLFVFHLGEKSQLIEIPRKPRAEVERLIECERKGEFYNQLEVVPAELLTAAKKVEAELKLIEEQKKAAEERAKEVRQALYEVMEKNAIKSFETVDKSMKITRTETTKRTSIDTTRLKKDLPEIAKKYTRTSTVKGSLRITLRG